MCLGIAEVGEHAVTHVTGHIPFVTFDGGLGGVLIGAIYFAQFFGVELLGKRGRTHQIAEHHGKLSAFRLHGRCGACSIYRRFGCGSCGRRGGRGERRGGAEDPFAWPHGQAELTQILISQLGDIA